MDGNSKSRLLENSLIFIAGILCCGILSILFGKELNWDLANYHYYNAFSFFRERGNGDAWPASFVHVHFTPTLDFLTYFLINSYPPILTVFLIGAIHGINFWLLYRIASLSISSLMQTSHLSLIAIVIALLGLYGPSALPGIGSFQHDDLVSLFVLSYVLIQLEFLKKGAEHGKFSCMLLCVSGLLLGFGAGCKLTAGLYIAGAGGAFLFLPIPLSQRIRILFLFGLSAFIGVLCASGYWMLFLWQKYHNPFFPLWNGIFHSPGFPAFNWQDTRFLPQGLLQILFYPFYFSWNGKLTSDVWFRDFRFPILYILFAAYAGKTLFSYFKNKTIFLHKQPLPITWIFLFFIFSYILWQYFFSIMRYIVALEMLAPLIIFLLLYQLIRQESLRFAIATILFLAIIATMVPAAMVRANWYEGDYFNVRLPVSIKQIPEAVVYVALPAYAMQLKPRPQTYLIPFFPANWHFIGVSFTGTQYTLPQPNSTLQKNTYLLSSSEFMPAMVRMAKEIGFKTQGKCSPITSDRQRVTHEDVMLCAIR